LCRADVETKIDFAHASSLLIWSENNLCSLCNTLQHTATHGELATHLTSKQLYHLCSLCNTLQDTATHCNTLQHTATHCNPLQHTATHCNTPLSFHKCHFIIWENGFAIYIERLMYILYHFIAWENEFAINV